VVRIAGKLERINTTKLDGPKSIPGTVEFAGVEDQYFLFVLLPSGGVDEVRVSRVGTAPNTLPQVVVAERRGRSGGRSTPAPRSTARSSATAGGWRRRSRSGSSASSRWGSWPPLRWIQSFVVNWGVAIIVLTAAIRVLLFPLNHKSVVAMKRMQQLQPKMKAIQERYKERAKKDPNVRQRMNQEVMALYKQEGVNPMGGCLPMLVQLPILYALYSLFAYAIELRHAPFVFWIKDLSAKDPTYITPILMTATMVLQQRLAPQMGTPPNGGCSC